MKLTGTFFGILLWISMLYIAGMYLFTKGFLLTRIEIAERSGIQSSTLAGTPGVRSGSDRGEKAADRARPAQFKRAVVMLIDALRYDFASFNQSLSQVEAFPFQNKLPVIHKMVSNFPDRAALFKSLADPPTTTLQRLKGIITGSLPTFIDAGHNFASFEISEDNIVDQLVQAGKHVVFMGDDTWMTLFTNKFHRAFPYPSFNVKDLHTVDEGILNHLLPEMKKRDWDVIIAHFLGVDHCGHSLGPYHASMGKKLTQMNSVIESVMKNLEEDTILFVLGDHGMTKTGDHGGDSPEELAAALFMYSPRKFIDEKDIVEKKLPESISQIDFVPTLCLLLGVPIPFSSLGAVIPPFFSLAPPDSQSGNLPQKLPERLQRVFRRLTAHHNNAQQVQNYITTYNKVASDFPAEAYNNLTDLYLSAEKKMKKLNDMLQAGSGSEVTEDFLLKLEQSYRNYILAVREMCRSVWAKFEMTYIYQGVALVTLATIVGVMIITVQHYAEPEQMDAVLQSLLMKLTGWTACAAVIGALQNPAHISQATSIIFIPSMVSIIMTVAHLYTNISNVNFSKLFRASTRSSVVQFALALSSALLHSALLTSDSHVINEGRAIVFFVQSVVAISVMAYSVRSYDAFYSEKSKARSSFKLGRIVSSPMVRMIGLGLIMMVCVRLSSLFVSCREEQYWCTQSVFTKPLSLLSSEQSSLRSYRYFLSIACIAALPSALIYYLSQQGNLSGDTGQVYSIRYALPLASVCMCMFWGQQALPEKLREQSPSWQQVVFPQITYAMIGLAAILQWAFPLNLLLVKRTSDPKPSHGDGDSTARQSHYSESMTNRTSTSGDTSNNGSDKSESAHQMDTDDTEELPPLVYGLGSVFSATYLHVIVSMTLLIALLNCDGLAPALLLMVVEALLFLEIYAGTRRKQLAPLIAMPNLYRIGFFNVPWYAVAGWSLMATQYFFATGHQATFTAIKFESAYVGFDGDFPRYLYFIPATLVSLNTFGSQIFFAAMLPLLFVWPFTRGLWATRHKTASQDEQQGELNLHTHSAEAVRALFQVSVMFLVFQACDLLGTMVAAAILRRHLMAWSVFAPRFIFQGVAFGAVILTVLVTYLFFVNIQRRLARWINRIPS